MRIVLTGGATGGHVVPFEPIIDTLRTVHSEQRGSLPGWIEKNKLNIYFVGVVSDESRRYLRRLDVPSINIPSGKLRRYASPLTVVDLLGRLPMGIILAFVQMWRIMPEVVISKGGYGSIPVALAAVVYRIPILLHESDAVLGLANRTIASWAAAITVGFEQTRKSIRYYRNKTLVTGTPVREQLSSMSTEAARRVLGLPVEKPVLLVMGGSQGAEQLNDVLLQVLPSLLKDMSVVHLTGPDNLAAVKKKAKEVMRGAPAGAYLVSGYLTDKIGPALAAADVVVTRAGATALAEMARLHKAIIIVPLDSAAQDHQRENANVLEGMGAARVIDPVNLGRALFEQNIRDLIENQPIRETLQNNIALLDRPQAARDIALLAFKLAQGLVPREPGEKKKK